MRVRAEREKRGWSQARLADAIGPVLGVKVYPTTIAKIEADSAGQARSVRLDEAVAIADALAVPLASLYESDDDSVYVLAHAVQRASIAMYDQLAAAISACSTAVSATHESLGLLDHPVMDQGVNSSSETALLQASVLIDSMVRIADLKERLSKERARVGVIMESERAELISLFEAVEADDSQTQ